MSNPISCTRRSRSLLACALLAAALLAPAVAQTSPTVIKVTVTPSDTVGQIYYAIDTGMLARAGISAQLVDVNNGAAAAAALVSGTIDIGFSNFVSLAAAHEKGLPFTVVAPANLSVAGAPTVGILSVMKTSPVHTGKDLDGKTVAVGGLNTVAMLGVRYWIDANGGDSSTVHFVEIPYNTMPVALESGRVDAASMNLTADPQLGKPGDPLRLLAGEFDALAPRFTFSAWFSTIDWVTKHPELAKKFAAVMRESAVWANAHHHESAMILAKYLKQSPEQIEGITRVVYGTDFSPLLIQPSIELAAKYGTIKKAFPASELLNPIVP